MSGWADIASLVARPGIDPRMWLKKGIVTAVTVDETGVYVDAMVDAARDGDGKPTGGWKVRAKYVFAVYVPVRVHDQVSLLFPDGNPNASAWCLGPEINEDDTLPQEIRDDPDSIWIRAPKDVHVRVKTEGDGKVMLDAPTVELGPAGSDDAVALWPQVKSLLSTLKTILSSGLVAGGNPVTLNPAGESAIAIFDNKMSGDTPASKYAKSKTT